jgi:hypothetical protein
MPFIPDEQEKTVKIPIQVRAGKIQFYFDGPLPDLKEGIIGDLVVPAFAVLDPKVAKLFSEERKIPLFKKKTLLYVQLRPETPDNAKPFAAHLLRPFLKGTLSYVQLHQETPEGGKSVVAQLQDHSFDMLRVFATIELQDTLYLWLRGTKAPTLSETSCKIPALDKVARSVNHACTLLSEAIERHRISHTTNVFKSVYFLRQKPDRLCPLDHVRHDRTVLFEERFESCDGGSRKSGV